MQKLVFIFPNVEGGVRTYNMNLSKFLKKNVIDHKVVSYCFANSIYDKKKEGDNNITYLAISKYASTVSKYSTLAAQFSFDDILICSDSFELEAILNFNLPNKIIYLLHGDLHHYHSTLIKYHTFIDGVICVSNGLKAKYERLFPSLKFSVSHPFVFKTSMPLKQKNIIPTAIFIGRFEHAKGADLLLLLIKSFKYPVNWIIVTTSFGSDNKLLNQIPKNVKVHKDISNPVVLDILAKSDVLILPSRSEGFGIAILEAVSNGVIPIVLDIPIGIPDQIIHGYNGFMVKEANWEKEALKYLTSLCVDNVMFTYVRDNALEFAKKKFNSNNISEAFLRQVESIQIKDKIWVSFKNKSFEQMTPEIIFRVLKLINARLRYGK